MFTVYMSMVFTCACMHGCEFSYTNAYSVYRDAVVWVCVSLDSSRQLGTAPLLQSTANNVSVRLAAKSLQLVVYSSCLNMACLKILAYINGAAPQ